MTKKKALHFHEKKLADQDYWNKLSEEEKEWLGQFNREYYQAIYKEEDRKIHPPEYDQELKAARSSRRKDIFDSPEADTIGLDKIDEYDNSIDNQIYSETEMEKLSKIDEKIALTIIREQAKDLLMNRLDTLENILSNLQRDSIKIFLSARKNK